MSERWIVIPRWRGEDGFQHYKNRDPEWIKVYTRLLHDDDYLALTPPQRALLHGLWLLYAEKDGLVRHDLKMINRSLGLNAKITSLEALNHAGWFIVSASKPLALRYQPASALKTEEEKEPLSESVTQKRERSSNEVRGAANLRVVEQHEETA